MAELVTEFAQLLEEELAELNQAIEERPVMGKDERKTKRRKLKKVLHKVKDDFSVWAEKYETYQSTFEGRKSFPRQVQMRRSCGKKSSGERRFLHEPENRKASLDKE